MALQVWLPLNGNLDNQGISNVSVSNPSGISYIDGKLGKCISMTTNNSISVTVPNLSTMLANGKQYSLSCWVKLTNNVTSGWVIKLGDNQCGLWWANSAARWVWNENDNGKKNINTETSSDFTNWHHLVTTVDKTTPNYITTKHYLDGIPSPSYETFTWDCSSHAQPTGNIIYLYPYVSLLNDVRLYDHILSPKEIKELSKGLVCHYPLNDFVGNENLFKIDEVATASTNYIIEKEGSTIHIEGNYKYLSFGGNRMDFIAGTTYTVSCHVKAITKDPNWNPRICVRNSSNVIQKSTELVASKNENFLSFTYTPTETITNGYVSGIITGATATSAEAFYSNIKCEIGSKVTPYIPAPTDSIYTSMGYDENIIYDTSGYGNNGTLSSNKPTVDCDSPRYGSCMVFNGTNNYIACGRGGMVRDAITVSAWGYMSDWSTFTGRLISCIQTGGWYFGPHSSEKMEWLVGTGESSNTYKNLLGNSLASIPSGWHMFTGTYDGLVLKQYFDGVLIGTSTAYSVKTPLFYNASNAIFIGAEAAGNQTTPYGNYFNGKISDVRIYAIALSDDDVMELYNTPFSIDNKGNIYALEYSEV